MSDQILKHFWVVTLLFLAGAAFLAAHLTSVLVARSLWVAELESAPAEALRSDPVARDNLQDYATIQDRNLFNANPKPEPPPVETTVTEAPVVAPPPVPTTPLNITLIGTAVVEGGTSFAFIQSGSELMLVKEGEEVAPAAVLAKVLADRILVERGGQTEEFFLFVAGQEPEPVAARGRRGRPARVAAPEPTEEQGDTIRKVSEDKWLIDRREVEQASENLSQLMTQIRVVPNFTDGQPDGFKVFAIRPGSLFSKIGLQNGDVLKRVNGIEIQGPEQAFEAYQTLKDETSIQIDLTRRTENKSFSYEVR